MGDCEACWDHHHAPGKENADHLRKAESKREEKKGLKKKKKEGVKRNDERDPVQTIGKLIDKAANMAIISYVDDQGFPDQQGAMLPPREREEIKVFWFTTNTPLKQGKVL